MVTQYTPFIPHKYTLCYILFTSYAYTRRLNPRCTPLGYKCMRADVRTYCGDKQITTLTMKFSLPLFSPPTSDYSPTDSKSGFLRLAFGRGSSSALHRLRFPPAGLGFPAACLRPPLLHWPPPCRLRRSSSSLLICWVPHDHRHL